MCIEREKNGSTFIVKPFFNHTTVMLEEESQKTIGIVGAGLVGCLAALAFAKKDTMSHYLNTGQILVQLIRLNET